MSKNKFFKNIFITIFYRICSAYFLFSFFIQIFIIVFIMFIIVYSLYIASCKERNAMYTISDITFSSVTFIFVLSPLASFSSFSFLYPITERSIEV